MALTRVLFAINPDDKAELARKIRLTLSLSLLVCLLGNLVLQIAGGPILTIFGSSYAQQATSSLRIIIIASLPSILKEHYTAICRMQSQMARAMLPAALGSLLELGFAILGARLGGLNGLCLGWVVALVLEALYMSFPVYQAARMPRNVAIETIPTAKLPIVQVIQEALKDDTQKLPAILQSTATYYKDDIIRKRSAIKYSHNGNIAQKRLVIKRYKLSPYGNIAQKRLVIKRYKLSPLLPKE